MLQLKDLLGVKATAILKQEGNKTLAIGIRFVERKDKIHEAMLFLVFYKSEQVSQSVFIENAIEVFNMSDKELAKLAKAP